MKQIRTKTILSKLYLDDLLVNRKIILLFILSFFLMHIHAQGQQREVTGVVSDSRGNTLPGANVVIKGTFSGVITDLDGQFTLNASPDDVLVFSMMGFLTEEIPVEERQIFNVVLIEDIAMLDEVVVIGYGVQKKRLLTGATSQVSGDMLEQRNTTDVLQALQGMTAGVNITTTSGQPGEGMRVNIRGLGTIGNATPLYIVDGVQTGDISYLNTSDIESIDVLKDAASAAIYGSRAANGVILITTRSGRDAHLRSGQEIYSEITLDSYYGFQSRPKSLRMLNTQEYVMIMNEQHLNSGGSTGNLPFNTNDLPAYTSEGVADSDWLNEMFVDNAVTSNIVLGATGGTEYSSYSMSLGRTGQAGIVGGPDLSNYERYTGRINSEFRLYDGVVTLGENLSFSYVTNRGIGVGNQYNNTLRAAFNTSPLLPMYDDNNEYFNAADNTIVDQNDKRYWFDQEANPYALMDYTNQNTNNSQKLIGNVYADIRLLSNLRFRSSLGLDYSAGESRSYTPPYRLSVYAFENRSTASQNLNKGLGLSLDNLLTYTENFGRNNVTVMAGNSIQRSTGSWMYGSNTDVAFDDLLHAWLNNATNNDNAALMSLQGGPFEDNRILSFFGRVQYHYDETYLFNASFRADGSSKFAAGNRWGYFPAFSAGWVMSNEDFMQGFLNVMPYFKLRGSWGQNGNSNIAAFNYLAPIRFTNANYNFGDQEGVSSTGAYPSRLSNENLKWETSEQFNIGFDAGFFDNRISANMDFYRKITRDWLIVAPVLATAGTDAPFINGGNVHNTGVELTLNYFKRSGEFNYQVSVVGAYNDNVVKDIPTEDGIIHGATNTLYANSAAFYRAQTGYPIGFFWGWETDGIFQTTGDVNNHTGPNGRLIQPNARPGDLRYVDQNGDGVINDQDKVYLGDPNPDFTFGFNFSATWRGFDALLITNGVMGVQVVQSYRNHTNRYANYTTDILDRWTGTGTSNTTPRVTNSNINYRFSDIFVQDADYLRISNVTLGYDFSRILNVSGLKSLRVYASVQNLYTFTSYTGMDPEVGFGFNEGVTDQFSSGIDLGFYPRPRTILFGVSVKY